MDGSTPGLISETFRTLKKKILVSLALLSSVSLVCGKVHNASCNVESARNVHGGW